MVLAGVTTAAAAMERNGRRSRGPSPNNNNGAVGTSPETSSDDENSSKKLGKTVKKSEYEEKIRVGRDYQAVCPELVPSPERKPDALNDRALLVWSPTKDIADTKLEEYISVAKEKYGYNGEQALGMLFWHKHDLERAVMDLANFTPFPDEWTIEDKVLFEQAFQFHGKSFHRIRQMLPDKSISSLVKFYYSWKKTRNRTSVMDRQEKVKKADGGSENGSEHGSNEDSDTEEKKWPMIHRGIQRGTGCITVLASASSCSSHLPGCSKEGVLLGGAAAAGSSSTQGSHTTSGTGVSSSSNGNGANTGGGGPGISGGGQKASSAELPPTAAGGDPPSGDSLAAKLKSQLAGTSGNHCEGCGVLCNDVNGTPKGKLCNSCFQHWRRTGSLRPTSGPSYLGKRPRSTMTTGGGEKHKRKPPRGMYINHDDIVTLASHPNADSDQLLASMDREIVSLMSQIQQNKQNVGSLKRKNSDASDDLRPNDLNGNGAKMSSRWSNEEVLLVVQGIKKYGKDFQAIAETIGTKSAAQVRLFFTNHKRKYDLDGAMKEFYKQQQLMAQEVGVNGANKPLISDIMEIDLDDDDSTDGVKAVTEKRDSNDGPLILPEGVNMSEITITKAPSEQTSIMSSMVSKSSMNGGGGASEKNGTSASIKAAESSAAAAAEKAISKNNNNHNNGKAAAVPTSTVTVEDDDDDVMETDPPVTAAPAAAAAQATTTAIPLAGGAVAAPPPPLKSIPAAIK